AAWPQRAGTHLEHARTNAGTQLLRACRPFGRGRRPAADGPGGHAGLWLCLGTQGEGRRLDEARLRLSEGARIPEARLRADRRPPWTQDERRGGAVAARQG